jgi:membrane protease YdiL (CAAX protease family)
VGALEQRELSLMRSLLRRLGPWTEFAVVIGLCLGWSIFESVRDVALGRPVPRLTEGDLLTLAAVELGTGLLAGGFLALRGWAWEAFNVRVTWKTTGGGLLLVGASYASFIAGAIVVAMTPGGEQTLRALPDFPGVSIPVALLGSVVNGCFEELVLVGYVFRVLERQGLGVAMGTSVLLRLLMSLYQGPLGATGILLLGMLYGVIYWDYHQLWPLILAHTLLDLLALARF